MGTFGVRNPLSASEKFLNPCLSCIVGKATGEVSTPSFMFFQMSNDKKSGCEGCQGIILQYPVVSGLNYNKPLQGSLLNNQYNGK